MGRTLFRILVVLHLAAVAWLVLGVDTSQVVSSDFGRAEQASRWASTSKPAAFLALHLMIGGCFFWALGAFGTMVLSPLLRFALPLGIASLILYTRFRPGSDSGDWIIVGEGALLFFGGMLIEYLAIGRRGGELLLRFVVLFLLFPVIRATSELATGGVLDWSLADFPGVALSFAVYSAGVVFGAATVGSARELFKSNENRLTSERYSLGRASFSLLSNVLVAVLASLVYGLSKGLPFIWTVVAPSTSLVLAVYAPAVWFAEGGAPIVFAYDWLHAAASMSSRAKLYLGVFFTYGTLLLAFFLYSALARRSSYVRLWVAHAALLVYWLPGFWMLAVLA